MNRDKPGNRSLSRVVRGLALTAAVAAGPVTASAHEPPPPRHADHDPPHGSWPGGAAPDRLYSPYLPAIGLDVRPTLEHWPSNYQPDGYRLRGYDGKPSGHHVCHGAHGTTLSSAGRTCPPGEKPTTGGRHRSTDGS